MNILMHLDVGNRLHTNKRNQQEVKGKESPDVSVIKGPVFEILR